jgi:uncharacterized protein (TIGR00299 family) protein
MGALLVLEPVGGIAGDMFLAAALDLGVPAQEVEASLRTLGLPGWSLAVTRRESAGVAGTHVRVVTEGEAQPGRGLPQIVAMIRASGLAPRPRAAAVAAFERLGRAEAAVHRVPLEQVHFHELGAVDSIVDLCAAAVVLELLGWPRVVSAPPELGQGLVRGAHGPMPVPPPAVLELLLGRPVRPGGPPGEAVTPTGATLLAEWAEVGPLPPHVPRRVGHGLGTRDWPDRPNLLRMTLGEEVSLEPGRAAPDDLWELLANLDDCPGELVARAIEAALEAGALDAWAAPLTMKKGRPGLLLGALCDEAHRAAVTGAFFAETTTLGVRRRRVEREVLERELATVETEYGTVRVKIALRSGRVTGVHPEFDDCAARARERGVAVREVVAAALRARAGR